MNLAVILSKFARQVFLLIKRLASTIVENGTYKRRQVSARAVVLVVI